MADHNAAVTQRFFLGPHTPEYDTRHVEGYTNNEAYQKAFIASATGVDQITFAICLKLSANNSAADVEDRCLIFGNDLIYLKTVGDWETDRRFEIFIKEPDPSVFSFHMEYSRNLTSYIGENEWFALMFSLDQSTADPPTYNIWLHTLGDSTSYNVLTIGLSTPDPPGSISITGYQGRAGQYDLSTTDETFTIGENSAHSGETIDFEYCEFYLTDEYVDWSSSSERAKYLDLASGTPIGLGSDGSDLTGTAARIYIPDGDATNNVGSAANFSASGTISVGTSTPKQIVAFVDDFATQSLGGITGTPNNVDIDQTLPALQQTGTVHAPGVYTGPITQDLTGFLTSNVQAFYFVATKFGPIDQTLPAVTQGVTATNGPGARYGTALSELPGLTQAATSTFLQNAYGAIEQSIPSLTQAVTGGFAPGTKTGSITQALSVIHEQALTATFGPGSVHGWIVTQQLPALTQAMTGLRFNTVRVDQALPALQQALSATNVAGTATGTIALTLPSITQLITAKHPALGTIDQTLGSLAQTLAGTFAAGTSTGSVSQTLPSLLVVAAATNAAGTVTGIMSQELPALTQRLLAGRIVYGRATGLVYLVDDTDELIWERDVVTHYGQG